MGGDTPRGPEGEDSPLVATQKCGCVQGRPALFSCPKRTQRERATTMQPTATFHSYAMLYNQVQALRADFIAVEAATSANAMNDSPPPKMSSSHRRRTPSPFGVEIPIEPLSDPTADFWSSASSKPAAWSAKATRKALGQRKTPIPALERKHPLTPVLAKERTPQTAAARKTPDVVDRLAAREAERQVKLSMLRQSIEASKQSTPDINPMSRRIVEKQRIAAVEPPVAPQGTWQEHKSKEGYTYYVRFCPHVYGVWSNAPRAHQIQSTMHSRARRRGTNPPATSPRTASRPQRIRSKPVSIGVSLLYLAGGH